MKTLLLILVSLTIFSCSTISPSPSPSPKMESDRNPSNFLSCLEEMGQFINYKTYSGPAASTFSQAKSLTELESLYGWADLIGLQRNADNAEILKNNANIIKLLKAPYEVSPMAGKNSIVTEVDANIIYKAMEKSDVNQNHYCYDTKGTIGFCFGRATIAHMEAIVRNVHPDLVKKIWIAGDMGVWGHHVATMVYTQNGWTVLDTNQGQIFAVEDWMKHYLRMKKGDKDIMVFITQAGRFGPYDNRPYNAADLFNTNSADFNKAKDYFNGYFHDYFESLDNVKNKPLIQR